jgi:hypothetical protein
MESFNSKMFERGLKDKPTPTVRKMQFVYGSAVQDPLLRSTSNEGRKVRDKNESSFSTGFTIDAP